MTKLPKELLELTEVAGARLASFGRNPGEMGETIRMRNPILSASKLARMITLG